MKESNAYLIGPGLALPRYSLTTEDYANVAVELLAKTEREKKLVRTVSRRSGIDNRYSVLADDDSKLKFYSECLSEHKRFPDTHERMIKFEKEAPVLAQKAVDDLLSRTSIDLQRITHLVTVSCTGFVAPGVDYHLIKSFDLSNDVQKINIGFQGCHAGLNAITAANALALCDPNANVLVVTVELCTLHMQLGIGRDELIPNSLFADGAAAFLVTSNPELLNKNKAYKIEETKTSLIENTAEYMSWKITNSGFQMTLDSSVPKVISEKLPSLLKEWQWDDPECSWAIHPGGPRILDAVAAAELIGGDKIEASRTILKNYGNMSSASVFFILDKLEQSENGFINMLGFGPGLNVEGCRLSER